VAYRAPVFVRVLARSDPDDGDGARPVAVALVRDLFPYRSEEVSQLGGRGGPATLGRTRGLTTEAGRERDEAGQSQGELHGRGGLVATDRDQREAEASQPRGAGTEQQRGQGQREPQQRQRVAGAER